MTPRPKIPTAAVGSLTDRRSTLAPHASSARSRQLFIYWFYGATGTIALAIVLAWLSAQFGYDRDVADMPVIALTTILCCTGAVFAYVLPTLIRQSDEYGSSVSTQVLVLMIATGVLARVILCTSEPMLEDDYQRYLWDGAVTAAGQNPYAVAPLNAATSDAAMPIADLAKRSGNVLGRVNHPDVRSIYPPVAQSAFALAHVIAPWSLSAWRAVVSICDAAILTLLLMLLRDTGRSPLWAALYWWNPLVLKEAINSAHMEPLVLALVLLSLWSLTRQRPLLATTALAFAAGAKLWPVLLFPFVVRAIWPNYRRLAIAITVFAALLAVWCWPIFVAGWDASSGFRAYAENWQTNSALFPLLDAGATTFATAVGLSSAPVTLMVKAVLAFALATLAVVLARRPLVDTADLMQRTSIVIAALVLLSPAQYPWYLLWLVPFLAFWPSPAFLLLGALIPLYYATFHFAAREALEVARPLLLAAIWVPVWLMAAREAWHIKRRTI